ncbi:Hypothetical predicted protein [Xyrichtys novacula]|uniref:Uncharacterized protein n=1 Tax=Xyrichtys novacula TaxID=13765 RepID=A0AAV1G8Z7_XYRNO|nr:Hypothetical predicted protein [Xyrichtys novacula]
MHTCEPNTHTLLSLTILLNCDICTHLAEKIAEPEGRISTFFQIHEAEKLLATIVLEPAKSDTASARLRDSTAGVHSSPEPAIPACSHTMDPPATVCNSDDTRMLLGLRLQ